MSKALILYESHDASRNEVLINKYSRAFALYGMEAQVLLTDKTPREEIFAGAMASALVINRTRDHALAAGLERAGVRVSNPPILNKTANNKLLTYHTMRGLVPMIKTVPLPASGEAPMCYPFVLKPSGGHGGEGVALINNAAELASYVKQNGTAGIIAQPFAQDASGDMRVYILGGRPAAAMLRTPNGDFRSNFCLGGTASIAPISALKKDELAIVEAVCHALPCDYCGVDIMRAGGRAVLNEIEDPVGARMLYIYTDIDPALKHVEYLLGK